MMASTVENGIDLPKRKSVPVSPPRSLCSPNSLRTLSELFSFELVRSLRSPNDFSRSRREPVRRQAACRLVFPHHFSFSQTSTRVSITQQKHGTCFLFLICCAVYVQAFFFQIPKPPSFFNFYRFFTLVK